MAPEQTKTTKEEIDSMKKNREELIVKKNEAYVFCQRACSCTQKKASDAEKEVKNAIDHCPKKETTSSETLNQRIQKLEDEIEFSSLSAQQEKEVKINAFHE